MGGAPKSAGRPRASSAYNLVLKGLGLAIVSGEFPQGSGLPSKEVLMRRFGVSNTPLREALQSLASKGLIAAKTRVGTWVRDETDWNMFDPDLLSWRLEVGIDHAFLAKLFEVRQTLEPAAAAIAARRRSQAESAELKAILGAMSEAGTSRTAFTEADLAFHLAVLKASGNPFMHSIGALIRTALAASFMSSGPTGDPERTRAAVAQHAVIVDAIADKDAERAAAAMMAVIRQGWINNGGQLDTLTPIGMQIFVMSPVPSPHRSLPAGTRTVSA